MEERDAPSTIQLSPTDHTYLDPLLRKGQMGVKQFKRATGLLELDQGKSITAIAETLGVARTTVSSWAKRYRQDGLQMLHDKPRSGRPIEIDGTQRFEFHYTPQSASLKSSSLL